MRGGLVPRMVDGMGDSLARQDRAEQQEAGGEDEGREGMA